MAHLLMFLERNYTVNRCLEEITFCGCQKVVIWNSADERILQRTPIAEWPFVSAVHIYDYKVKLPILKRFALSFWREFI